LKIHSKDYRVPAGKHVNLREWPTRIEPVRASKEGYRALLSEHVERMRELQDRLYASDRYALLVIFQAMDAAGKDGAIKHVMSGVNPQGCEVWSFKHPSEEELQHDFLWRTSYRLPPRGKIGIFNRSYYEEVLIVRVHPRILRAEGVPGRTVANKKLWHERYRAIVDLERHLFLNGTRVVKFFLHLSSEEQRKRFLARIDDPKKNWKLSPADLAERKYWRQYMRAYEKCLAATSTDEAPWYVVPADDKDDARVIISQIILDTLAELRLDYPETTPARGRALLAMRRQLARSP
jgi:PPK2 family polyphosphate:nucleotide phosphotransferase